MRKNVCTHKKRKKRQQKRVTSRCNELSNECVRVVMFNSVFFRIFLGCNQNVHNNWAYSVRFKLI